ncbi:hypothetical protein EGW08_010676, partial [Elysia chlorotica]
RKYFSIIGAHFAMAPLSFLWVYGNLSAYMESYFRFGCSSGCMDGDSEWLLSLFLALGCPGILLTKLLVDRIGLKWTGILGAAVLNAALLGSAWTVPVSVAWTTVLLGVLLGLAQGLTLTVLFQVVSAWAPDRAALYMSTTTGAATALSILENQLVTAIVNPENLKPDAFIGTETDHQQVSLAPSEVLRAPVFYAILMYGIGTLYSLVLKANYYKQFALLYIHDDRYLTLVGTLIPIFASVSRIAFGAFLNKRIVSIKGAIIFSLSVNCVLCSFWYFIPQINAILYLVFVLCLAVSQSLYYVITPAACVYVFGPAHFPTNYGLVLSSLAIVGLLSPVVIPRLMYGLGWQWLFASSASFCAV